MTWKKCAGCTRAIAADAFTCEYCGQLCDNVMGYLPSEEETRAPAMTYEESQDALRFAFESSEPDVTIETYRDELTLGPPLSYDSATVATFDEEEPALETRQEEETPAAIVEPSTPHESAKPAAKSIGPRQLAMVGGGVLAAGALIFTILGSRSSASLEPSAAPNPAPAPAPRTAAPAPARPKPPVPATDAPTTDAPHWTHSADGRWVTNSRHTAAFEVEAIKRVHVWTRDVTPVLVVRCDNGKTEAFVYTQSAARMEPQDGDHTVTVAFDGGSATTERWPDSDEHDALFARHPIEFTRQLTEARALHFGFTPHNAQPVVATFALDGLTDLLAASSRQCGNK